MMLGAFEITALSDGTVALPLEKMLRGIQAADVEALIARSFETLPTEVSINAFLINTGRHLVLVDAGAGELFAPTAGGLLFDNLKAAGYSADQIDSVLLTHIHADHSGGLVVGGQAMFPNADIYVAKQDKEHWFSPHEEARAAAHHKHSFQQGRNSLQPYIDRGKVRLFEAGEDLLPGIRSVPAPGHTPGHTLFDVESEGQKLLLWGDTVHAAQVQLPRPSVTISFDTDEEAAAAQRAQIFASAALDGYLVAAAHISFPGLGHLRGEGDGGYRWVPVNYSLGPLSLS